MERVGGGGTGRTVRIRTHWKTCVEKWKKVRGHWGGGVVFKFLAIHVCLVRAENEKGYSLLTTGMPINGAQNRRRCPMGRAPRIGDQKDIRLRPGFPDCPRQYHGFHLSQANAYQWNLLDARGRITHFPSRHCGSARDPRGPR